MKKVVHLIAAARPNFMKIAPLYHALLQEDWCDPHVLYTGQHSDANMVDVIVEELGLPTYGPCLFAKTPGDTMDRYATVLRCKKPDAVVVPGDVNGSLGCALAAKHANVPLVHLEAGLRSGDRRMCEEINRIAIDAISDLHWAPTQEDADRVNGEFVGNIMIDAFEMMRPRIQAKVHPGNYAVATLHRPSNVDDGARLTGLLAALEFVGEILPVKFVVHPRTWKQCEQFNLFDRACPELQFLAPMSYVDFMALMVGSRLVITDSGGVQEETTYLGIPCATLRKNTERPVTIDGTNVLCRPNDLEGLARLALEGRWPRGEIPELWDGHTAERCVASLKRFLNV